MMAQKDKSSIWGGRYRYVVLAALMILIIIFVKKRYDMQYQCTVVFEDDILENHEDKMMCVDNNETYSIMELQYMTQYSYPTDVVFAGDSITYRCQWNEIFPELSVKNRGIGSDTTKGLLARVDSIIKTQPRKVFIMIGINDIVQSIPEEDMISNYCDIIDRLSELPDIEIYVQSILPVYEGNDISKEKIIRMNDLIENICTEKKATYIDLYYIFSDDNGWLAEQYSVDGVHINAKGYECWKNSIEAYVY